MQGLWRKGPEHPKILAALRREQDLKARDCGGSTISNHQHPKLCIELWRERDACNETDAARLGSAV